MWTPIALVLLTYLPGALLFRLPLGNRVCRSALRAEERLFWSVLLSLLLSSFVALVLGLAGGYQFWRVVEVNAAIAATLLLVFRGRLRFGSSAPRPGWASLQPVLLIVVGLCVNFAVPPAEYVIGGRDPGVYFNQGIRLAQRGGFVVADEVVQSVPPAFRHVVLRQGQGFPTRFMAFSVLDPVAGTVVGQFPHGLPIWIAIGYGVNGLSGARAVPGLCAVFGLLAVYFVGSRLAGRWTGFVAAALLAVNVAQVWYARYPSAEILLQPLAFAGLLACVRAVHDRDGFFTVVSALLLTYGAFTHLTGTMVSAAVAAALLFFDVGIRRGAVSTLVMLGCGMVGAGVYLWRYLPPYFEMPAGFLQGLSPFHLATVAVALVAAWAGLHISRGLPDLSRTRLVVVALTTVTWMLAAYAGLVRTAGGALAPQDADALRTFTSYYLSVPALLAGLLAVPLMARSVPVSGPFLFVVLGFATVFFYKIRIVPEHFWAARRFLAVILPGALLLAASAGFGTMGAQPQWLTGPRARRVRLVMAVLVALVVAGQYIQATRPILQHVEYAGVVPRLERLAAAIGDEDLLLVEPREISDVHVLALPLGYIYARNVLVFSTEDVPRADTRAFITWARARYKRLFVLVSAGQGIELLSRSTKISTASSDRFLLPEYEPALNSYPRRVKLKEFDLVLLELLDQPVADEAFRVDIGGDDDPYVTAFHAKERDAKGLTFRWTRDSSELGVVGLRAEHRTVTLWMGAGGRPATAPPARVQVSMAGESIGEVEVTGGVRPYDLPIPAELAVGASKIDEATRLRLAVPTWNPSQGARTGDTRDLGVILDRVEIH